MLIDNDSVDTAALIILNASDGTGTSPIYDDHALVVEAQGVGGAAQFYRIADTPTE